MLDERLISKRWKVILEDNFQNRGVRIESNLLLVCGMVFESPMIKYKIILMYLHDNFKLFR